MLGSTEWVENHAETLAKNAVAYINTDSNGRGFLGVGGSHTLEKFINEVGRDIPDPQTKMSVWERARAQQMVSGSPAEKKEAKDRPDLRIDALGSGSDFTPFLQHLGIASLNIGFGGEDGGGSYHSIYDSFAHYTRFGDPDFAYGIALAKVCGHATLRLANADTLPFEFTNFAETVSGYADEVAKLADSMREDTKTMNNLITSGMLKAVQDPKQTYVMPKTKEDVPELNFGPLKSAVKKLDDAAKDYQKAAGDKKLNAACAKGSERGAVPVRAGADERPGAAEARVVQAPGVCARVLYGLRRQDAAGDTRGDRAERLEGSGGTDRYRGAGDRELCR